MLHWQPFCRFDWFYCCLLGGFGGCGSMDMPSIPGGSRGVEVGVDINVRVRQSGQSLHVGNCIKPTDRTDGTTDTGGRLATVVSPSLPSMPLLPLHPILPLLHATAIISK